MSVSFRYAQDIQEADDFPKTSAPRGKWPSVHTSLILRCHLSRDLFPSNSVVVILSYFSCTKNIHPGSVVLIFQLLVQFRIFFI